MNRRQFVAAAMALGLSPARAEPAYKQLIPLLIDLPGFEGRKPDGRTMTTAEGTMTTASRFYVKAPASLDVTILSGPAVTLDDAAQPASGALASADIDGFRVLKAYNASDKAGALLIGLDKSTLLTVDYKELAEDEAVALARKLDWKAIAAAAK